MANRVVVPPRNTPWGRADHIQEILPGMWSLSTPSHGGIWLSPERYALVPDYLQQSYADGPWYEEDCDWAVPFCVFEAELLLIEDEYTRRTLADNAHRLTLRNWRPDDYERFYGVTLQPGESLKRDEQRFHELHANDWLVIAASGDWKDGVPKGMVEAIATRGGVRQVYGGLPPLERTFFVPAEEYSVRTGPAFVIDPARHQEVGVQSTQVVDRG